MDHVVLSIIVLAALFAAAALPWFDLGMASLAAAFVVGISAGLTADEVTGLFPADFFVLIVGVTALFGVLRSTGTLDWLMGLLVGLVRGRLLLVTLVPFLIGAVLVSVGTLPIACVAIVVPIALGIAARNGISPLVAAVIALNGVLCGLLSPLAVYGVTALDLSDDLGLGMPGSAPITMWAGSVLFGLVVAAVVLGIAVRLGAVPAGRVETGHSSGSMSGDPVTRGPSVLGGHTHSLATGGAPDVRSASGATVTMTTPDAPTPVVGRGRTHHRIVTLIGLVVVLVLAIGFDVNIGYLGITVAAVEIVILRLRSTEIVDAIPWRVVLLIGGLLTYVGLMQQLGAFKRISSLLDIAGSPLISLLVLCYVAGVTSFAASSIAVFVTAMPLLPSLVAEGVSPVGAVLAVALAAVMVDVNPLGATGGLVLAAAEGSARERLFKQLLVYGLVSVAVAPAVTWAVFGWW